MATSIENDVLSKTKAHNGSERGIFYKKPIKKDNYKLDIDSVDTPQEVRRQRLLQFQKKCREITVNAARGLVDEALNSEEEEHEDEMDVDEHLKRKPQTYRRYKHYANQLMLSEWMWEVPQDFLENWIMVPCPEGKRTLVVACKGITKAYNKRGHRLGKFHSALPGGNPTEYRSNCTILDCLWKKQEKTYYVLDVLAWSNQSLLNCDTEFRFFWLKSKLSERESLQERGVYVNTFPILPLPTVTCDTDIGLAMTDFLPLSPLDGLLFYHRHGQYTKGHTPLVTWLKTFMLPEVLGVSAVPPFDEKPDGYIDLRHYILDSKARKKTEQESSMEVADDGC